MIHTASNEPSNPIVSWFRDAPWRILVVGIVVALVVAAVLMYGLMAPPLSEVTALVTTLAVTSVLSVGLGFLLYRRGWARSSSLLITLVATYIWAAILTLINVWVMQRRMFISEHDLVLSGVLLLFAAIIATTYGLFIAASVTDGLRELADTADRVAAGDLSARAPVQGRDEVARVTQSFNAMAEQLQAAANQREELEMLRRNLIAWTSHDLRTPLTSIQVRIEALNDGLITDPDTLQHYYQTIRADGLALNRLIDDLFEMAQLEAGGLKLDLDSASLSDLVSDCLESFMPIADQRGVVLTGEVTEDVDPVLMDAARISRVLSNLCGNALRHTPDGGNVNVRASRDDNGVLVTVEDSGSGFAPADLPNVFEQFYRGEPARTRANGGAGLGLAISRGIVEAHGGRIWAENRPSGGALVGFYLPDTVPA
ncbi:MAG: HAMP domain-containing sensor histidine kinase [Chloroflexota bacterium]